MNKIAEPAHQRLHVTQEARPRRPRATDWEELLARRSQPVASLLRAVHAKRVSREVLRHALPEAVIEALLKHPTMFARKAHPGDKPPPGIPSQILGRTPLQKIIDDMRIEAPVVAGLTKVKFGHTFRGADLQGSTTFKSSVTQSCKIAISGGQAGVFELIGIPTSMPDPTGQRPLGYLGPNPDGTYTFVGGRTYSLLLRFNAGASTTAGDHRATLTIRPVTATSSTIVELTATLDELELSATITTGAVSVRQGDPFTASAAVIANFPAGATVSLRFKEMHDAAGQKATGITFKQVYFPSLGPYYQSHVNLTFETSFTCTPGTYEVVLDAFCGNLQRTVALHVTVRELVVTYDLPNLDAQGTHARDMKVVLHPGSGAFAWTGKLSNTNNNPATAYYRWTLADGNGAEIELDLRSGAVATLSRSGQVASLRAQPALGEQGMTPYLKGSVSFWQSLGNATSSAGDDDDDEGVVIYVVGGSGSGPGYPWPPDEYPPEVAPYEGGYGDD